jgi:hypothetical protein
MSQLPAPDLHPVRRQSRSDAVFEHFDARVVRAILEMRSALGPDAARLGSLSTRCT